MYNAPILYTVVVTEMNKVETMWTGLHEEDSTSLHQPPPTSRGLYMISYTLRIRTRTFLYH